MSFRLHGTYKHRWINLRDLMWASARIAVNRALGKPVNRAWRWDFEVANLFFRLQMTRAMSMKSLAQARQLIDSIEFDSPPPHKVDIRPSNGSEGCGFWVTPENAVPGRTLMYLHGGGYTFFARAHLGFIAHIACAARAQTFAPDYRLTPEHPYPAQLDDAYAAYRALLAGATAPGQIVLAGDSAGGHLVLSLLNKLRQRGEPMPALGICLCPWTEVGPPSPALYENDAYDWVQGSDTQQFAAWLVGNQKLAAPEISPIAFDGFNGFPPLYMQAGGREVLLDMIVRFARKAAAANAEITLDVWPEMTHDFQAYGSTYPESTQALDRIGAVADHYLGAERTLPLRKTKQTSVHATATRKR